MGSPYGPHYGLGDNVSDYVLYYQWLSEPSGPPVEPPTASFTYSPSVPKAGETVTFDASTSAPNGGTIIGYKWGFGDGNTTTTTDALIVHVYDTLGTYNVTLTVTDSEGLTDSTWQEITVIPAITIVHDVAVTDVAVSSNIVYQGWIVDVNVTVANLGNATENFTVTLYYDNTTIATHNVQNLEPNATLTLRFAWNTAGVPYCHNYTIKAVASTVPGEINVDNNVFIDGWVKVKILGDINGDGVVDARDIAIVIRAFGSYPGHPRWNPEADLNGDNKIDAKDVALTLKNFGKTC
jgi:PKD repeat protein